MCNDNLQAKLEFVFRFKQMANVFKKVLHCNTAIRFFVLEKLLIHQSMLIDVYLQLRINDNEM